MREDWQFKTLGELGTLTSSKRIFKKEYVAEGVPFYRSKEIKELGNDLDVSLELYISKQRYLEIKNKFGVPQKGDILLTAVGTIGEMYVVDESHDFYFKDGNIMWLKNFHSLDSHFLKFTLTLFVDQLRSISKGSAYSALTIQTLKKYSVPIPPLSEQKAIVKILDEAFAKIDQAKANNEKNIENAKELFLSKKQRLFEELRTVSQVLSMPEICEEIFAGGDAPKQNMSKTKTDNFNIPIIANAVKDNGLYGYTTEARVLKPSITIAARGSGTGHTEIRNYPFLPIVRLIVLTPKSDIVDLEFLKHAILNLVITRSGSAIPQLTIPMIKTYSLTIPELQKQKEIVSELNEINKTLDLFTVKCQQKLTSLKELKKSLLQKAFSGELTNNFSFLDNTSNLAMAAETKIEYKALK